MLVKLKRGLHRAKNTVRRPFRRNKREKSDYHDFHIDWDGLGSFSEVLDKSPHASGPLKSAIDELWRRIEMFESNEHETKIQSCEEYEELGIDLNDLFRALSKFFDGTSSTTHQRVAELARGIENEINDLQSEQPATEHDVEGGPDVQAVLGCYHQLRTLLGRFVFNENTVIWKMPDENLLATRLDSLPHSPAAQYRSEESNDVHRAGCTPNTRMNMLQQLQNWAHYNGGQRIYWLNGLAGTGKTTIAYSFCEQLENAGKLAASFFCSRQLLGCWDVKRILPSISHQLSSISRPFRCALSSALEDNEVHNLPFSEQLVKLVAEPLLKVKHTFPANMVVVIDALDECRDDNDVNQILDILLRHASDLPVKFFIASRPSLKILNRMRSKRDERVLFELCLHKLDRSALQEDIRTYLMTKLKPVNLPESDIALLVQRSGVFFTFAATIVDYLGHDNFSQGTERLNHILPASISSPNANNGVIDLWYTRILQVAFDNTASMPLKGDGVALVLYTIACALEPLTVDALAGLLKFDGASLMDNALVRLQPLLFVSYPSGLVTALHESFRDYLLDQKRSDGFYCDPRKHHASLARACFDLINVPSSPFNICKLESSYLRDREVPNIDRRVKDAISPELLYACRYWGAHHELAGDFQDTLNLLHKFLATRLLLWMEILNLNRCMSIALTQLYRLCTWLEEIEGAAMIRDLAHDAWKFAVTFSTSPMRHSTPHIYVSMLPFWPERSSVSKHYTAGMLAGVKATGAGVRKREWAAFAVFHSAGVVTSVAYSPDSRYIVSGSQNNSMSIWDAHTGQSVGQPLEGHTRSVHSVAYSPNGACIVSGSSDKTIRVRDARTGQSVGQPLEGHTGSVSSVAYSPNGAYIVSGSSDNTIRIWDARTGNSVGQPLKGHIGPVSSVAYSPNGAYIVSGSYDNTIRTWDAHTRKSVGRPLKSHPSWVLSVAYSPNGEYIVAGLLDKTIRIWNAHTGKSVGQPLEGHTSSVLSVAYSPNGAYVVSGSSDKTIRIWDAHAGKSVGQPLEGHTHSVNSVAYSPNGAYIVSGSWDKTIRIWDAYTWRSVGQPLEGYTSWVSSAAYSPGGVYSVSDSSDKTIHIWDVCTWQSVGWPLATSSVSSVAYSPNGAYIVSGSDGRIICIWDARTGKCVGQPLEGHTSSVNSVAYSPNGAYIVSGLSDNTIRIWNAPIGKSVGQPLEGHIGPVNSVAYSPNGAYIVSGSDDKAIRIWDAHTGKSVGQPLVGHTSSVRSVAYSPNGAYIVSGSWDNTIRIWDAHTGQSVGQPLEGHRGWVRSVMYSLNGTYIVSGLWDNTIRIWDACTGKSVGQPLEGHIDPVSSVAYSPNGAYIVSGSWDKTIRIWDARTGKSVGQPLVGHTSGILSVAYSPNGAYIVSGSSDNTIRIWDTRQTEILGPPAGVSTVHSLPSSASEHPLSHPAQSVPLIPKITTAEITEHTHNEDAWTLNRQGWIVNAQRERLIWVPHDVRDILLRHRNIAVIPIFSWVRLDFRDAQLGEEWARCFDPKQVQNVL